MSSLRLGEHAAGTTRRLVQFRVVNDDAVDCQRSTSREYVAVELQQRAARFHQFWERIASCHDVFRVPARFLGGLPLHALVTVLAISEDDHAERIAPAGFDAWIAMSP